MKNPMPVFVQHHERSFSGPAGRIRNCAGLILDRMSLADSIKPNDIPIVNELTNPLDQPLRRRLNNWWFRGTLHPTLEQLETLLVTDGPLTHSEIASEFGVGRTTVTKWFRELTIGAGELQSIQLRYKNLLTCWNEPSAGEKAKWGYIRTISFLRREVELTSRVENNSKALCTQQVWLGDYQYCYLFHAFRNSECYDAVRSNGIERVNRLLPEILYSVRTVFPSTHYAPEMNANQFLSLVRDWGAFFELTMLIVPYTFDDCKT